MSEPDPTTGRGELSLRIVGGLVRHIEEFRGPGALAEVLEGTRITREDVATGGWAPLDRIELLLEQARRHYADEESFTLAFGHRLAETLGPLRYLAWATSPMKLFVRGLESMDTLSTISHAEVSTVGRGKLRVRYWSDVPESRLLCLSRQGQLAALPTIWGLEPAQFEESACIGHGDPHCLYHVEVPERRELLPDLAGLGLGLAAAVGLFWLDPSPLLLLLPATGLLAGRVIANRRAGRAHREFAAHSATAMRQLALEEADARREILALNERQQRWTRHVEAQLAQRVAASQALVARFTAEREARALTVRGVSHDLRNPITTLVMLEWQLRCVLDAEEHRDLLEDHAAAVDRLDRLVDELVRAMHGTPPPRADVDHVEIGPLPQQLERRLRALVYPREIAVVASATDDAPAAIDVDPLIFDRVIDNLLTNAAKNTERGRIEVQLGGDGGQLTVRVSDTGCGIDAGRIEKVFRPRGELVHSDGSRAKGFGLATTVQLMADVGGRLDVKSKVGVGTTFWARFPLRPPEPPSQPADAESEARGDELVRKIVRFRSSHPGPPRPPLRSRRR